MERSAAIHRCNLKRTRGTHVSFALSWQVPNQSRLAKVTRRYSKIKTSKQRIVFHVFFFLFFKDIMLFLFLFVRSHHKNCQSKFIFFSFQV